MAEKHIYFIRHGQSEYNLSPVALGHDTPLTLLGESQAKFCATRCAEIDFDVIFSSSYQRAIKTAEIISKKNGIPLEINDLLLEYRYPDTIIGLPKKGGPDHLKMLGGTETRYPGGELYADLKARAEKALALFELRDELSMVVVTHSFFLFAVLNSIIFGKEATFKEFERLNHSMKLSNTGVTHCTYGAERPEGKKWKVITWNDDAHLGEI